MLVKKKFQPIFIAGAARNGTTWLGNTFVRQDECVIVNHYLHHGAHEINFVALHRYYGDLSSPLDYIKFLHEYSSTDDFKLTGCNLEFFLANPEPDFYNFFCSMMEQFAHREGAKYWVIKLDLLFYLYPDEWSSFLDVVNQRYGSYKVIGIERELSAVIRSYLNMEGKYHSFRGHWFGKYAAIVLGVARQRLYVQGIRKIISEASGVSLKFEKMVRDEGALQAKIAEYIQLPDYVMEVDTPPNTSFPKGDTKKILNQRFIAFVESLVCIFPGLFAKGLRFLEAKKRKPVLYRRILMSKFFPAELINELEGSKSCALIDKLSVAEDSK